ncbi:hypothetical protein GP486_003850 [Trichoglossum hirsutum]|uniref:Xaa-Pro aminopeptidase n=1 Tax=Trichoglossum hirsutum TaxID=265104 RepID=A0A9P8LCI0_9PEZI|nr:hypothetical protein GP486_003850 [Trichoglossum hirsutum]
MGHVREYKLPSTSLTLMRLATAIEEAERRRVSRFQAGDINQLHRLLAPLVAEASVVCTDIPKGSNVTSALAELYPDISRARSPLLEVLGTSKTMPLRPIMNGLRVFKSSAEIRNMRLAGKFSGRSFTDAMRRSFTREKDLRAFLECEFKLRGCDTSAYVPVVAGGKNALSIHYVRNDDILRDGELVLVDAGGEYGGYIADITRTWPANGKFSPAQKDLYQAILMVQRTCVALCREDANVSLDKLHSIAEDGLEDQLKQLGFDLSGKVSPFGFDCLGENVYAPVRHWKLSSLITLVITLAWMSTTLLGIQELAS